MAIWDFLKGELIEIIEWNEDARDIICWRFPDEDKAIKNGAQLIVRESQVAQFMYLGEFGDTFGPGKHTLNTDNIPILTRLKSWKFGLESPFKADVFYVNVRLFTGNKWGTSNPIMMRDDDFGIVRARAFGTYDFRVVEPRTFIKEVAGADHNFRVDEFETAMRSKIVSSFSDALATANVPLLDAATKYTELGDALLPLINPVMRAKYGMEISTFVVENISVPEEVQEAIDDKSSMSVVGDLNEYVKFQLGKGLDGGGSGTGGGGAAGTATELAVGLAIAQQIMAQQGGMLGAPAAGAGVLGTPAAGGGAVPSAGVPAGAGGVSGTGAGVAGAGAAPARPAGAGIPSLSDVLTPAQVADALGVGESDVLAIIESGELKAKKIGSVFRIKQSSLDAFLAD